MTYRIGTALVGGVAALALAASPAAFAQGKGNDKGNGNGKSNSAAANKGNGGNGKAKRDQGNGNKGASASKRGNQGQGNARNGRDNIRKIVTGNNGNGNNSVRKIVRGNNGNGNRDSLIRVRSRDGVDIDVGFALPQLRQAFTRDNRIINGCPPGLAKKNNGCLPPGQAKKVYGNYSPGFFGLSGINQGDYFYNGGYLLRYDAGGLGGFLPLLGGALGIGNIWPRSYSAAPLPDYYTSYYGLNDPRGYRYADDVIYRVDPETAAITSVAALLTGNDITIGSPMPRGYDVYNVPYAYRDRYYDSPSARYRYSDGYIYEVDPETALVVSAIDLVV